MSVLKVLCGLLLCAVFATDVGATNAGHDVEALAAAVNQRLAMMPAVAAYKWHHELPLEDLARERVVVAAAAEAAESYGIDPATIIAFFARQIDAAKDIQERLFTDWRANPGTAPAAVADLTTELRPKLVALGDEITYRIAQGLPHLGPDSEPRMTAALQAAITVEPLSADHAARLGRALARIRLSRTIESAGVMAAIIEKGVLRVGTTGDYAPFSHTVTVSTLEESAWRPAGIDIDLAAALAEVLGVALELVPTSWPTLMDDLEAERFDVALSGISRRPERQRRGFFSVPYHVGGKTAIGRCGAQSRFASLAAIDVPGVRVIVNPGGTNQAFVNANIHRARVRVFPDNRTIFTELVEGRADVMFTDAIEVRLQTNRHPVLCPMLGGALLTRVEKAVLMQQDPALKRRVDAWLTASIANGRVAALFDNHTR